MSNIRVVNLSTYTAPKITEEKNKDFVKEILANEIVSRYYYQKGRIQSSLNYDKDILEAITVLSDSTKYKQILSNID